MHHNRLFILVGLFAGFTAAADYPSKIESGKALDHVGDYIVPAPAELASVSAFKIAYSIETDVQGRKVLSYQLPDLIAGPKKPVVVLTQTGPEKDGFVPFENKEHDDSASCRVRRNDITCFVLYPGMDTTGAEDVVRQRFANSPELNLRLNLAQVFSSDPKGVLHIKPY